MIYNAKLAEDIKKIQELSASDTVTDNSSDSQNPDNIKMNRTMTNEISFNCKVESIAIDKRDLQKIVDLCENENDAGFDLSNLCLGVATLLAGASLGAISSGLPLEYTARSILFYILFPMAAVGFFVAFFFISYNEKLSKRELANRIMEYMPKKQLEVKRNSNEH